MQQVVAWYISTCTVWTKRRSSLDITRYFDSSAAESGSINQMLARMPLTCLAIDGIHIAEVPKILIDCVSIPIPKEGTCIFPTTQQQHSYIMSPFAPSWNSNRSSLLQACTMQFESRSYFLDHVLITTQRVEHHAQDRPAKR
jgi:hypothetical protein